MSVSSITGSTATATDTASAKEKSALGKDDFLKLLVAQLKQQDPLKPQDGTEFVTQLSQFSLVEQSVQQSSKLDILSTQMTGLASNEAAGLVGKDVTVRGTGVSFDGVTATGAGINLDASAAKVTVQIQDSTGKTVRTMELGAQPAGAVAVKWDGKDDNGQPVAKGTYTIKTDAKTADGKSVNATQDVTGKVVSVSFAKGYPELILDSGVTAPISELVKVGAGAAAK